MMTTYPNYWNQWQQQPQQQYMMAPYYYYNEGAQQLYYPNYVQPQSSQYVDPSGSKSYMSPTSTMNPMGAMYPMYMGGYSGTICPTGTMNPTGGMQPIATTCPTGSMKTMGVVSPTGTLSSISAMSPTNSMKQQYYGMYPQQFYNNNNNNNSNNFQKYENFSVQHNNYKPKAVKNDKIKGNVKTTAASKSKSENDKKKVKHSWWKVNVNKSKEAPSTCTTSSTKTRNTNESLTISNSKRQVTVAVNRIKRKQSSLIKVLSNKSLKKPSRNQPNKDKKINNDGILLKPKTSLIVLKNVESFTSQTQESQEIFHLINGKRPEVIHETGIKPSYGYFDYTDIQCRIGQQQIANMICNNNSFKEENDKKSVSKVSSHCQEILSKFAISETSNDFIKQTNSSQNLSTNNYKDLGKNINNTMLFIMKEMHSLDSFSSTNYLSLKLTPRQKQSIALLIIDEVNAVNVPEKYWAHVCRLVIHTLNENFKLYFEKLKDEQSQMVENEKNSWLWMVELANNVHT